MIKKLLFSAVIFFSLTGVAFAAQSVFTANQVGTSTPTNGYVLQSQGNNMWAQWVATSTLGISGGGSATNYWSFSGSNLFPSTTTSYVTADHFVASSTSNPSVFPQFQFGWTPWLEYENGYQSEVHQLGALGYYSPRSIFELQSPSDSPYNYGDTESTLTTELVIASNTWNGTDYTSRLGSDEGCERYASDKNCYLESWSQGYEVNGTTPLTPLPIRIGFWNQNTYSSVAQVPFSTYFDPSGTVAINYSSSTNATNGYSTTSALLVYADGKANILSLNEYPQTPVFTVDNIGDIKNYGAFNDYVGGSGNQFAYLTSDGSTGVQLGAYNSDFVPFKIDGKPLNINTRELNTVNIGSATYASPLNVFGNVSAPSFIATSTTATSTFLHGISITTSGSALSIFNPSNGNGVNIDGDSGSGGDNGTLRIVSNGGGWTDNQETTYFEAKNDVNTNLSFMGGTAGGDVVLNRLQFDANTSQFTNQTYNHTPPPVGVLEADNATAGDTIFALFGATSQSADYMEVTSQQGATRGNIFYISGTGNVGIGSSSPVYKLVASSTEGSGGTNDLWLDTSNANFSAGGPIINFGQGGGLQATIQGSEGASAVNPYLALTVTGGSRNETITKTGIGIGTTSPIYPLSVIGSTTVSNLYVASATPSTYAAFNQKDQLISTTSPSGGGAVSSVSNVDGSLTISPTTGSVVASLNLGNANAWSALQEFNGSAQVTGGGAETGQATLDVSGNGGPVNYEGVGDVLYVIGGNGDSATMGSGDDGGYGQGVEILTGSGGSGDDNINPDGATMFLETGNGGSPIDEGPGNDEPGGNGGPIDLITGDGGSGVEGGSNGVSGDVNIPNGNLNVTNNVNIGGELNVTDATGGCVQNTGGTLNGTGTNCPFGVATSTDFTGLTTAMTSFISYSPGGEGTFLIIPYLRVNSRATDVIELKITYQDETNTVTNLIAVPQGLTSGLIATTGSLPWAPIIIRANSTQAITVSTVLTTGGGSINYDVGANIQQIE